MYWIETCLLCEWIYWTNGAAVNVIFNQILWRELSTRRWIVCLFITNAFQSNRKSLITSFKTKLSRLNKKLRYKNHILQKLTWWVGWPTSVTFGLGPNIRRLTKHLICERYERVYAINLWVMTYPKREDLSPQLFRVKMVRGSRSNIPKKVFYLNSLTSKSWAERNLRNLAEKSFWWWERSRKSWGEMALVRWVGNRVGGGGETTSNTPIVSELRQKKTSNKFQLQVGTTRPHLAFLLWSFSELGPI